MKRKDYVFFGQGMYWDYFQKTGKEFAASMSENFEEMSLLSKSCFKC